jgi:integrase
MSKNLQETQLSSRSARQSLPEGTYWRGLDANVHLGYRRGKRGGKWLVRWYLSAGKYKQAPLGVADDTIAAGNLDFQAASKAARELVSEYRNRPSQDTLVEVVTVGQAVHEYIEERNERDSLRKGLPTKSDAHYKLTSHVLNCKDLCELPLGKVTAAALVKWKKGLAASLKSTARARIVIDFKAALNRAIRLHEAPESRASLIVKNGLAANADPAPRNTDQRENQILSDDDIRKLISTAKEDSEGRDFYFLVLLLAATGARFSQLTRILVRDVQLDKARVLVPVSHKGSTTKSVEFTAVPLGNDILDALRPIIEGRPSTATLLERWRLRQVSQFAWERVDRGPWKTPSEMLRNWNAIVKRCGIERCVPYALRHSSIVRGLVAGQPIRMVAAAHDTSVAMIEKHYARYIIDAHEELRAKSVIRLA